jgi:7,8-dihydro-6-hydroxymethylpterin-pyrophosphokinase
MNKKRLYIAYGSNLNIRQMAMRSATVPMQSLRNSENT